MLESAVVKKTHRGPGAERFIGKSLRDDVD